MWNWQRCYQRPIPDCGRNGPPRHPVGAATAQVTWRSTAQLSGSFRCSAASRWCYRAVGPGAPSAGDDQRTRASRRHARAAADPVVASKVSLSSPPPPVKPLGISRLLLFCRDVPPAPPSVLSPVRHCSHRTGAVSHHTVTATTRRRSSRSAASGKTGH